MASLKKTITPATISGIEDHAIFGKLEHAIQEIDETLASVGGAPFERLFKASVKVVVKFYRRDTSENGEIWLKPPQKGETPPVIDLAQELHKVLDIIGKCLSADRAALKAAEGLHHSGKGGKGTAGHGKAGHGKAGHGKGQ